MAVLIPIGYIQESLLSEIKDECTISYQETFTAKPITKTIHCYVQTDTHILLPFHYSWTKLKKTNDYPTRTYGYKKKLGFLNEAQEDITNQVIKKLINQRTCALTSRTGSGKTGASMFASCQFQGRVVVLVSDETLQTQWMSSIKKYTTAKYVAVDCNGSRIDDDVAIIVCMYTRWDKLTTQVRHNLSLLVVDECDTRYNRTGMEAILNFTPLRILVCTATFNKQRTKTEEAMLRVVGPRSFVECEFDVKFNVYKFSTGIMGDEVIPRGRKRPDWVTLKQSLLYSKERNEFIVKVIKLLLKDEGRKIMVIASETAHVDILTEMLDNEGVNVDWLYGDKNSIKNCDVLVGGTKKCGRGFDEESFCPDWDKRRIDTVVRVDFAKDPTQVTQENGRAFRAKDPLIVHFVDRNNAMLNQWRVCKKLYDFLGANITKCSLED